MTCVTFVVTGFSKFNGVEDNPTERLVSWLARRDIHTNLGQGVKIHSAKVLRVATTDVDAYFNHLQEEIAREFSATRPVSLPAVDGGGVAARSTVECSNKSRTQHIVLLNLGVAHTANEYRLESRAYNCATFRVPDEDGWCPTLAELEPGKGTEFWVGSQLPLEALRERLAARGHVVEVSTDAGRFVCNWTYYRACRMAEGCGCQALFVHVPPFNVYGEAAQQVFLSDVIRSITDFYIKELHQRGCERLLSPLHGAENEL